MPVKHPAYNSLVDVLSVESRNYLGVDTADEPLLLNILLDDITPGASVDVTVKSDMLFDDADVSIEDAADEHLVLALAIEGHAIDTTAHALDTSCEHIESLATQVWSDTLVHVDELRQEFESVTRDDTASKTNVFIKELFQHL